MFYFSLTDDRLIDTPYILIRRYRRDVQRNLERDLSVLVNVRGYIDVYADIDILKLGIDQPTDRYATDAGLIRPCRSWYAVPDLNRRLFSIQRSNLRVLNNLGATVSKQGSSVGA